MAANTRIRPKVTEGVTVEFKTGCGTVYVTVNRDEHGLCEVFLRVGKSGSCGASLTEAIANLVTLCIQHGIEVEEVVRKLKGIRCLHASFSNGTTVLSCADAVARALETFEAGVEMEVRV